MTDFDFEDCLQRFLTPPRVLSPRLCFTTAGNAAEEKWKTNLIMRFSGHIMLMGLFFTMGCVTSLSMQNGPFALNKGEHEVFASGGWTGHSQVLTTSYAAGEDLWQQAQGEKQLSEEEFRNLLDAGLGWLLFFPGFNAEFAYRTGLPNFGWPKWDVGVRTDGQC